MEKNKILILLLLFVFSECIMHASSMNQNRGRYVIISFERKIRGTRESPQMYFWIMPINDSLSVEDNGAGVKFNVYVYNIQPGVTIDYTTGKAKQD